MQTVLLSENRVPAWVIVCPLTDIKDVPKTIFNVCELSRDTHVDTPPCFEGICVVELEIFGPGFLTRVIGSMSLLI